MPKQHDGCLFCSIARDGVHVHKGNGFVAINDINPKAPVHVLVIPERHVDTFRDVSDFDAKEAKRMLEFVAETAEKVGLTDYRVLVNVGAGGGQTISHLHWHILGGGPTSSVDVPAELATAEYVSDVRSAESPGSEEPALPALERGLSGVGSAESSGREEPALPAPERG
ncbi:MAG: HIT domain-containing protein [Gaiellaceae bacterium]